MQPIDKPTSAGPKPSRNPALRYLVALALLVAIVGGIAWVTQYMPGWRPPQPTPPPPVKAKKMLAFVREVAQWGDKKDDEDKHFDSKDYEPGTTGHYDFLLQNISDQDVDVVFFATSCDCTTVKVSSLPADEWERLKKEHAEKPSVPLAYAKEPRWLSLPVKKPGEERQRFKPGEHGAIRVEWTARDLPGTKVPIGPIIAYQAAANPEQEGAQMLFVPARIVRPLQIYPSRLDFMTLTSGQFAKKDFLVWSSTRDTLDFTLTPDPPDPLFVIDRDEKPIPKSEWPARQLELKAKGSIETQIRCAYRVTVTVHESKGGRQLDQGTFFRQWAFALDGRMNPDAPTFGPDIIGRVLGDIRIGGEDGNGKILFKSFSAKAGASKEVQLVADAKVVLEKVEDHPDQPSFVTVKLTGGKKQASGERAKWLLEVIVPPNRASAGAFLDSHAVVLRIAGTKRLVRIPLDGHILP